MRSAHGKTIRSSGRIMAIVGTLLATVALVGAQPAVAHHKAKCTSTGVSSPSEGVYISAMQCKPIEHKTTSNPSKAKPAAVKKPAPSPTNIDTDAGPLIGARRAEPIDFVPLGDVRAASREKKNSGAGHLDLIVVLAGGLGLVWLRGLASRRRNRTAQLAS